MHVTIVSLCEKRAWPRSRAILDSYAVRVSERSWQTPITEEGLNELRAALKRIATRQNALACYRNQGVSGMKLLWTVGQASKFGPSGHFPGGMTKRKPFRPAFMTAYAALHAKLAGLTHDLGKASTGFQKKLMLAIHGMDTNNVDPVHHSWISMLLMRELGKGKTWDEAWGSLKNKTLVLDGAKPLIRGLQHPEQITDFIAGTHHRLFGSEGGLPGRSEHIKKDAHFALVSAGKVSEKILCEIEKTRLRLKKMEASREISLDAIKGVSILSRIATILADHTVSNHAYGRKPLTHEMLKANTRRKKDGSYEFYQGLDDHLGEVGKAAADMLVAMSRFNPEGLSEYGVEKILSPAGDRFEWQNKAVAAAERLKHSEAGPAIVFNIATTGAGKTIGNLKIASALADKKVRLSVALNLRSLTLQTGESLRRDLDLGKDELATVIGDKIVEKLYNNAHTLLEDAIDFETDGEPAILPGWMKSLVEHQPGLQKMLTVPLLVSTIDHLIDAGNPGRQGHHIGAFFRVMRSDLVLDELDSYDPSAMGAVMRLIYMAGLCGRNVICSSATLSVPLSLAAIEAFEAGQRAWRALNGRATKEAAVLMIHNALEPTQTSISRFEEDFAAFTGQLLDRSGMPVTKLAKIVKSALKGSKTEVIEGYMQAYLSSIDELHEYHAWELHGKRVSFGFIRVANIRFAQFLSRFIARKSKHVRVASYHANLFLIERHLKEKVLDNLFKRKGRHGEENKAIEEDPYIRKLVLESKSDEVKFVLVATPVEEVGRDHDFDWGIIEPSSIQSILQAAGRINRHRQWEVFEPNIIIMKHNFRMIERVANVPERDRTGDQNLKAATCFFMPGVESRDSSDVEACYRSHSVDKLMGFEADKSFVLDASVRFDPSCEFSIQEDRIIAHRIRPAREALSLESSKWMATGKDSLYEKFQLREGAINTKWRLAFDEEGSYSWEWLADPKNGGWRSVPSRRIERVDRVENDWLAWSVEELKEACEEEEIALSTGLSFSIMMKMEEDAEKDLIYDKSFGVRRYA